MNSNAGSINSRSQDDDQQHEKHESKRRCTHTTAIPGTARNNSTNSVTHENHRLVGNVIYHHPPNIWQGQFNGQDFSTNERYFFAVPRQAPIAEQAAPVTMALGNVRLFKGQSSPYFEKFLFPKQSHTADPDVRYF
jgi:hypothetical protein